MKRLRDIEDGSPLIQDAQRLLDAAPPTAESTERMQRVRRAIDQAEDVPAFGFWRRPLSAMSIALGVLLVGASALAAVGWYMQSATPAVNAAPTPRATSTPVTPRVMNEDEASPPVVSEPATATPKKTRPNAARPRSEPAAVAEPSRDSALVHQALKALRRDHDPATAARLLREQRASYPESPLAEEALSLQIEAALALQDPRARELATQYVARYPQGRYVAIAARALKSDTQ